MGYANSIRDSASSVFHAVGVSIEAPALSRSWPSSSRLRRASRGWRNDARRSVPLPFEARSRSQSNLRDVATANLKELLLANLHGHGNPNSTMARLRRAIPSWHEAHFARRSERPDRSTRRFAPEMICSVPGKDGRIQSRDGVPSNASHACW